MNALFYIISEINTAHLYSGELFVLVYAVKKLQSTFCSRPYGESNYLGSLTAILPSSSSPWYKNLPQFSSEVIITVGWWANILHKYYFCFSCITSVMTVSVLIVPCTRNNTWIEGGF